MRVKDAVGRFGEKVAADHLEAAGLTILDRNWRCRDGELDIVARDGETLIVVEVKTRSSLDFGTPAEAIDRRKAARLRRLALRWMADQRGQRGQRSDGSDVLTDGSDRAEHWSQVRFDVVSVLRDRQRGVTVDHLVGVL